MKRLWLAYLLLLPALLPRTGFAADNEMPAFDHSHKSWSQLLASYLNDQYRVDYKRWHGDQKRLDAYLNDLQKVSLTTYRSWSANQRKAFLINAYNALTVKLILNHYPVASIRKIGGFFSNPWKMEFFSLLDGKIRSIDPIEHEWLRKDPELRGPRIHAAVNCASISCPVLQSEAFVAERLDQQLDAATRQWLADPQKNRYDPTKKTLYLSKIFDWYEEDFGDSDEGILAFVKRYGPQEWSKQWPPGKIEIDYLDYDWGLNEVSSGSEKSK